MFYIQPMRWQKATTTKDPIAAHCKADCKRMVGWFCRGLNQMVIAWFTAFQKMRDSWCKSKYMKLSDMYFGLRTRINQATAISMGGKNLLIESLDLFKFWPVSSILKTSRVDKKQCSDSVGWCLVLSFSQICCYRFPSGSAFCIWSNYNWLYRCIWPH